MPHFHSNEDRLRCPYKGCEKSFEKPAVLADNSTVPRETYYACPHCMSKLDIITQDLRVVDVRPAEYPKVFDSPAKCARYSALLNVFQGSGKIPDECLVCPKVLQCSFRKG
jgi:hypothetical protein